tara:strand:- start:426 stop:596 length:171 start_codon:yes stop_codon:yes gene_type:complete
MLKTVLIILTLSPIFSASSEQKCDAKPLQNEKESTGELTLDGQKYRFLVTPWVKIK